MKRNTATAAQAPAEPPAPDPSFELLELKMRVLELEEENATLRARLDELSELSASLDAFWDATGSSGEGSIPTG